MTDDKIEAAAREAAIDHGEWLEADADETNCDSFVAGFKAGHASRDAEIAALRAQAASAQAVPVEAIRYALSYLRSDTTKTNLLANIDTADRWLAAVEGGR